MSNLHPKFLNLIADKKNWPLLQDIVDSATRIVGDFDTYGETLQADENGLYNEWTNIEMLRGAIIRFDSDLIRAGDYLPHLTEQQQNSLKAIAIEVLMAADGDEKPNLASVEDDVSLMTPHERLTALGWFDRSESERARLEKRLGFNPITGVSV